MSAAKRFVESECKRVFAAIPLIKSVDKTGKDEIVDTLLRHCQNDAHVTAVLRSFAEDLLEWKNPIGELVRIARATQRQDEIPAGCEICCLGPDIDSGVMRWAAHVSQDRNGFAAADRCMGPDGAGSCPRGAYLRQKDAERKVAAVKKQERRAARRATPAPFDAKSAAAGDDGDGDDAGEGGAECTE